MNRLPWIVPIIVIVSGSFVACSTSETSVRPGINDSYYANPDAAAWADRFEVESREIWRHRHRIVDELGLKRGQSIADVGAGTGFFTLMFARRVGSEGRVFAVDIIPAFLDNITRIAEEQRFETIETVLCREDDTKLPPSSVDLVFLCDVYHHFEYPRGSLASIHAALRPGGDLVVIDFIREPGISRPWVLGHVRAGEAVVRREIESAGFIKVGEARFLEENYLLRFRKINL